MQHEQDNNGTQMELPGQLPPQTVIASSLADAFDAKGDATKVAGIVVAILYLVSGGPIGPLGIITMAAAISALFLPDFFPEGPVAYGNLSTQVSALVIPFIEQSQTKVAISNADAALQANIDKCTSTAKLFETWLTTNDPMARNWAKESLQHDYIAYARDYLPGLVTHFTSDLFRGILIPQYVKSAAIYLPLLICYYQHAVALEIIPRPGFTDLQEAVLAHFRKDLQTIIDTTVTSYKNGLQKIINSPSVYPRTWLDYNNYRNVVTRTGLDVLPALVLLDPTNYPAGCSLRYLNRHLYTFLDTSYENQVSLLKSNITSLEQHIAIPMEVAAMKYLALNSGRFTHNANLRYRIDGLYRAQVNAWSVDGFISDIVRPPTGSDSGGATIVNPRFHAERLDKPCIQVHGRYWNGRKNEIVLVPPQGNVVERYTHVITQLGLSLSTENGNNTEIRTAPAFNSPQSIQDSYATNEFESELPPAGDFLVKNPGVLPLSIQLQECLADFRIIDERSVNLVHYAFTWAKVGTRQDLLPAKDHETDPLKNTVEQFHAVRAARSIYLQDLRVIAGPGFTGGDLVEVRAGASVEFQLRNTASRWFNGLYRVKIWVINPNIPSAATNGVVNVDVKTTLENSAGSVVSAAIQPEMLPPDLNNLKFAELRGIPFFGWVIIPSHSNTLKLTFINLSLSLNIILDRIELIFYREATAADMSDLSSTSDASSPFQA